MHFKSPGMDIERVEFINYALRGIPEDRVRYHICWGSWHGPHANDIQLSDIVDRLLRVNAQAYLFEASNAPTNTSGKYGKTSSCPTARS